jgi:hypothetical protein
MSPSEVAKIVDEQLSGFQVSTATTQTYGRPWSSDRWAAELERLRQSLVVPQLKQVHVVDARDRVDGFTGVKDLWVVTQILENSYVVVYDNDLPGFGLAVAGRTIETVGIWGDLPSTFAAR